MDECVNINNLADNSLVKIFSKLPVEDLIQLHNVCPRWIPLASIARSSVRALFLYDSRCICLLRYMHAMYGSTFDMFHSYRIKCEHLNSQFAEELLEEFPLIERLIIAIDLDAKLLDFLQILLKGYAKRLTYWSLITGFLEVPFHHNNELVFYQKLATFLKDHCELPVLRHLQLYNQSVGFELPSPIQLPFERMPLLEEFNYGMPSDEYPHRHALQQIDRIPHLKKFATLFQFVDVEAGPRADFHTQLDAISNRSAHQIFYLTVHYTHYFMDVSNYFDSLTRKFLNLQYLHISLRFERVHIDELLTGLSRLQSLSHLRLSEMPLNYLTDKFQKHCKSLESGQSIPKLNSIRTLQFSYCNWQSDNTWRNLLSWNQLQPLVSLAFPRLRQLMHSNMRYRDFPLNYDLPKPVSESTHLQLDGEPIEWPSLGPSDWKIGCCLATNLLYLDTSAFLLSPLRLISLLERTNNLRHLRIRAPRDYFHAFEATLLKPNKFTSLTTLHLDHISTGDGDPFLVIPCRDFLKTAPLWPFLEKLKLDGLIAKFDYFQLTPRELEWLRSLNSTWPTMRKVYLLHSKLSNALKDAFIEKTPESSDDLKAALYQMSYLLEDKTPADEAEPSNRLLSVIQQALEFKSSEIVNVIGQHNFD